VVFSAASLGSTATAYRSSAQGIGCGVSNGILDFPEPVN